MNQSHMLRTWAMAEVANPRWAENIAGVQWPLALKAKMDAEDWAALTEDGWGIVEHVLFQLRGPLLGPLLPLQAVWYEGTLPIEAVAEMRFMRLQPFLNKVPASRRLVDLADAERGAQPGQPEFIRASMVGLPITVGETLAGPFTLVEGYTRCCRALRDHHAGLYDGLPIPVLVGVTEKIREWPWW